MASRSQTNTGGLGQNKVVGIIAAVFIVAALIALVQVYRNSQIHAVRFMHLPPGSSEKAQAMKAKGQRPFGDESASDLINPGGTTKK